ncbi:MAG: PQQ-binding-like beta-propeller repeat protein, partial [Rhodopirellula sp.]|nr:PQQ-binding-like beta-propeller repeat protein [Rhodopirellula sp.]
FYGSSRNDSVTAVDLKSGEQRWRYFAEGPVRFAPLVHKGRVYFGADDGALYCLDAQSGSLQWRFVAAPTSRKVIGSERVISVWPVRGGPLLVNGRIHFTVGVWPFEGTFLYSLDPATGKVLGDQKIDEATGAVVEHDVITLNDLTPQGYLAANGSQLLIPQGRATVATLDWKTRKFGTYTYGTHSVTNYHVSASDRWLFHGSVTYDMQTKKQISSTTRTPVVTDKVMYATEGSAVVAFDLNEVKVVETTDRRGKKSKVPVLAKLWSVPFAELRGVSTADAAKLLAENPLVIDLRAGHQVYGHQGGFVFAIDVSNAKQPTVSWNTTVEGDVSSMISANGRLVVTTSDGQMLCFGAGNANTRIHHDVDSELLAEIPQWSGRVAKLLEDKNPGDAYCVALGSGSGGLISELIRQSKLRIVVVDSDPKRIDNLRQQYDRRGIYGTRLVAHLGNPLQFELPPYMVNLVVTETPELFGLDSKPAAIAEVFRILRPYGGAAWLPGDGVQHAKIVTAVDAAKLAQAELKQGANFSLLTRPGALPGSADWTHEYGDAANTLMSRDNLVKAPLGVLWFGGPASDGSLFYNRHYWGPSMAVIGGRMFLQGPGKMTAVDVYTGRILWQLPLEGKANYLPGRRGNDFEDSLAGYHFLAVEDAIYLVHDKSCLKLDPRTGEQINEFKLQKPEDDWGRIRVVNNKLIAEVFRDIDSDKSKLPPGRQLLAGSKAAVEIVAMDRNTGSKIWSYEAEASFPVLSVGTDRVFAFDGALENFYRDWKRRGTIPKASDIRMATAIDLETGKLVWKQETDFVGTWMSYGGGKDVVLMSNKSSIMAINGRTGKELWKQTSEGVGFRGHPESLWDRVIVWNDRLLDQRGPGLAWELTTGKRVPRIHPITKEETPWEFTKSGHHCNYAIASPHLMTFRAGDAGFCDIESGNTSRLKGFRSGCRNSLIPANGVLNAPNMAHGCVCGYSLFTSLALVNLPQTEVWSYSALKFDPQKDAVRRIGINFGAPGDRQDDSGTLWVDYPNKGGTSPDIPITVTADSPRYFRRHSSLLQGEGVNWVAGSGVEGATSITLTLSATQPKTPQYYTVRLHFAEPDNAQPGERVFDIALQGKLMAENVDIARDSGSDKSALVREFNNVEASSILKLDLTPRTGRTVLSGIEVVAAE